MLLELLEDLLQALRLLLHHGHADADAAGVLLGGGGDGVRPVS